MNMFLHKNTNLEFFFIFNYMGFFMTKKNPKNKLKMLTKGAGP